MHTEACNGKVVPMIKSYLSGYDYRSDFKLSYIFRGFFFYLNRIKTNIE